jgi:Zn-dependent protease with chaperone function
MTLARRWRSALGLAVLLAAFVPLTCAPLAAAQAVPTPTSQPTARPPEPKQAYTLPPGELAKAVALSRISDILAIVGSLWGIAFLWLLLATRASSSVESWTQRIARRPWLQGLIFFALFLIAVFLAGLPLDVIGHLASRRYGISVQGWASWLGEEGKSLGLSLLVGAPLLLFFNWMVRRWPRRFWLCAWLITLPLMLLATFAEPLVIDPLFNKFEPLQKTDPALVQQLEKVVKRTGIDIPPSRMFLMKASTKTNGINAYVTGFGPSKRIVVWDTTINRIPDNEILFIFGHETGHYVLHHIAKGLTLAGAGLFFVYWGCAVFAGWLARRFGPRWGATGLASRTGFVVLLLTLSLAGFLLEPVSNAVSRHFEHQADIYGQEAIHGIVPNPQKTVVAAFNALGRAWLSNPHPNPFFQFWLGSHPSIQQRATFAEHYDPWKNGGHGKYFMH